MPSQDEQYTPPPVWTMPDERSSLFSNINRSDSGALFDQPLPQGDNPIQLYSMATPNGVKVSILLEELLALGVSGARYDAHLIKILEGEQFSSGFCTLNPNSKIPAIIDRGAEDVHVFESGAVLLYLSEKFDKFIPPDRLRAECLSWLFWQVSSTPYLGGGLGHFYHYATKKIRYPIDRYAMEVKRQLDVLDTLLSKRTYICGDEYTIADIAIWPWYGVLVLEDMYNVSNFIEATSYRNVVRWAELISHREAVKLGRMVLKA